MKLVMPVTGAFELTDDEVIDRMVTQVPSGYPGLQLVCMPTFLVEHWQIGILTDFGESYSQQHKPEAILSNNEVQPGDPVGGVVTLGRVQIARSQLLLEHLYWGEAVEILVAGLYLVQIALTDSDERTVFVAVDVYRDDEHHPRTQICRRMNQPLASLVTLLPKGVTNVRLF